MREGKKRARGAGLIEVLVGGMLLGLLTYALSQFAALFSRQQTRVITITKIEETRSIFATILQNRAAWLSTVNDAANTGMACLKNATDCSGLPTSTNDTLQANDASGTPVLNYRPLASPSNGFTMNGTLCNSFAAPPASGNDDCPFRLDIRWRPICPATGPCIDPQVFLEGTWTYNPRTPQRQITFNGSSTTHGFRLVAGGFRPSGCNIVTSNVQSGTAYGTTVQATCAPGKTLTGGGCQMVSYVGGYGTGGAAVHYAYPQGNTFLCQGAWGAGAGQSPSAYAICCD